MHADHGINITTSPALVAPFKLPSRSLKGKCNLCLRETENMKVHVSRHLQQLATFAIPRADFSGNNDEDGPGVSNHNATGSISVSESESAKQEADSGDDSAAYSRDEAEEAPATAVKEDTPGHERIPDNVDEASVPDAEDTNWDTFTDKFARARDGRSELAPTQPVLQRVESVILLRREDSAIGFEKVIQTQR